MSSLINIEGHHVGTPVHIAGRHVCVHVRQDITVFGCRGKRFEAIKKRQKRKRIYAKPKPRISKKLPRPGPIGSREPEKRALL
ncbi:hypothetical protein NDU88_001731 [Pleurodeles waltl]|uniref:Uncharacterized protein n=1 Tax=Pleurodeles waltl TaxID=8319 RepID=A0AAV7Q3Z1_PLEWA|nr:hypothetical protein NDU88_001731 [Pleurodeles waltl]